MIDRQNKKKFMQKSPRKIGQFEDDFIETLVDDGDTLKRLNSLKKSKS